MKTYLKYSLLALFIFTFAGLFSYELSYAYLSDQATSSNNTFTSATQFVITPPVTSFQTVIINEIMWMGSSIGGSSDEWIELRNMTSNTINLSNWSIEHLGSGNPGFVKIISGTILPNSYYLIAKNKTSSVINIDPDLQTNAVSLTDTGEQLILANSLGDIIDVANGTGAWLRGDNSTPKKSMSRNAIPGDGTVIGSWFTANSQANIDSGASESATPKAGN